MSVKRQATTELNHENWDQEDPVDPEEDGNFKIASKEILEKRVIRTAKRRSQVTGDEPKKSVFSGFGGFNKTQPASFDFLSKLTNGNNENKNSTNKTEPAVTSSLFSSKALATSPGKGLFSLQPSPASATPTKSSTIQGSGSLFGLSPITPTTSSNLFSISKPDTATSDSPFKMQSIKTSDNKIDSMKSTTSDSLTTFKELTSSTNPPTTPYSGLFKMPTTAKTTQNIEDKSKTSPLNVMSKDTEVKDKKMEYYSKLTGLNESVAEWIKTHVEQTPLCILTPIFKDYEKYLEEIQEEYQNSKKSKESNSSTKINTDFASPLKTQSTATKTSDIQPLSQNTKGFSFLSSNSPVKDTPAPTFSFGINTSNVPKTTISSLDSAPATTTATPLVPASSTFLFTNTNTTTTTSPFSFGIGKPFSFNSNIKQNSETNQESTKEDDEDTPPKVEYTPVVEENSVYDKKCKIFVKKDGNFVDKGVGTLYIKKVADSSKHQLLVRANTNLGTILVNLILVSDIPTQRMGKNNVMMVCIPTPDSKPPPTPILVRVKTSEEADELLTTLNKYKT